MANDIDKIKTLRDSTGLSFNEIKKALSEAGGDVEEAKKSLKELGIKVASKKSSRDVKEGLVASYVHSNKKLGSMVELLCETDFVARNDDFQNLAKDISMHIVATRPENSEDLLAQPFIKDPAITVQELINQHVAKLGENIQLGKFVVFEI